MKLQLINGEEIEIFRQNCGYQYHMSGKAIPTVEWNINPVNIIEKERKGYFIIGPWGCGGYQGKCGEWIHDESKYERMIPIKSVLSITESSKWEREE